MTSIFGFGSPRRRGVAAAVALLCGTSAVRAADYVVQISIDGLRADAITALTAADLPNFYRLRSQGAFTDNARTNPGYTYTLPNHTSMITGRGVDGPQGHNYVDNGDPPEGQTLHTVHGSYVASAFDVAHDAGLHTAMYASKTKFVLFDTTYDADTDPLQGGAPGPFGRDKIDTYVCDEDTAAMTGQWKSAMNSAPYQYSFLHYADPDAAGHANSWDVVDPNSAYLNAVRAVDAQLGVIFDTIQGNAALAGHTSIILTADHGGQQGGYNHDDSSDPQDYTIPFYVWGAGVAPADLYAINVNTRLDPGTAMVDYDAAGQPIRNGDGGNLALALLGLGAIPGSTINAAQNLAVPEPATAGLLAMAGMMALRRCRSGSSPGMAGRGLG